MQDLYHFHCDYFDKVKGIPQNEALVLSVGENFHARAFTLTKEQWIEKFGDRYGLLLHAKMDKQRKDSEKLAATDISGHMLFWKRQIDILNISGRHNMAVC